MMICYVEYAAIVDNSFGAPVLPVAYYILHNYSYQDKLGHRDLIVNK